MTKEEVDQILSSIEYTFAKTMPKIPHWYTLEKKWDNKQLYKDVVDFINSNGYQKRFYNRVYTYYNVGEYKYWAMKISDGSGIINRTLIENE